MSLKAVTRVTAFSLYFNSIYYIIYIKICDNFEHLNTLQESGFVVK